MSDHKSNYIAMKFKYSFLKFQTGGYNSNDAINLAAAATAVINCANFDNKAVSVDCYDPIAEKITLEARLVTLNTTRDNLTGIKNAEARMKIEKEIADVRNQINVVQSRIGTSNVANRTCDKVLATVASIYLAIIHNKHDGLVTLINDLASMKINNSPTDKRTPEKRISVAKYYLNNGFLLHGSPHEGLCFNYNVINNILFFLNQHNDIKEDLFHFKNCVEEFSLQTIANNEVNQCNLDYGFIYIGNGVYNTYDENNENLFTRKIDFDD
jgi:hypothetical protein